MDDPRAISLARTGLERSSTTVDDRDLLRLLD
jgi:hypothetical protein